MGPIWGRQDPCWPHVGPMNFAICVSIVDVLEKYDIHSVIMGINCTSPLGNKTFPDSKVHGANMGPIWGRQDTGGPMLAP